MHTISNLKKIQLQHAIDQAIRVNHAGETGAVDICNYQIMGSKDMAVKRELHYMLKQEKNHLAFFQRQMQERQVRPTFFSPIWRVGAAVLGFVTAKMGTKYAMSAIDAIEDTIGKHYQEQLLDLQGKIAEMSDKKCTNNSMTVDLKQKNALNTEQFGENTTIKDTISATSVDNTNHIDLEKLKQSEVAQSFEETFIIQIEKFKNEELEHQTLAQKITAKNRCHSTYNIVKIITKIAVTISKKF